MSERLVNIWRWLSRLLTALLTAAAVVLGVLIQLILVGLVCSVLPIQIALPIIFISPFLIGVGSYFIFQRVIKRRAIRREAERWLAERSRQGPKQRKHLSFLRRVLVWLPAATAFVIFLFLPEMFGVGTHVLYPGPATLHGYEVRLPLAWMAFGYSGSGDAASSYVYSLEVQGPLRSGLSRYWHGLPRTSGMSFWTNRAPGRAFPEDSRGETLSARTFQFGAESVKCREYVPVFLHFTEDKDTRAVDCSSASSSFSASFHGDKGSVPRFYRTLQNIRRVP